MTEIKAADFIVGGTVAIGYGQVGVVAMKEARLTMLDAMSMRVAILMARIFEAIACNLGWVMQ